MIIIRRYSERKIEGRGETEESKLTEIDLSKELISEFKYIDSIEGKKVKLQVTNIDFCYEDKKELDSNLQKKLESIKRIINEIVSCMKNEKGS